MGSSKGDGDGGTEGRSVVGGEEEEEEALKARWDGRRAKAGERWWGREPYSEEMSTAARRSASGAGPTPAAAPAAVALDGGGRRLDRTLVPWPASLIIVLDLLCPTARWRLFFL